MYPSHEDALSRAQQEISELVADSAVPREGFGASADELVQVTVRSGRVDSVDISPRAMRMPSADLGVAIAEATNAALADLEAKFSPVDLPQIDIVALQAQLTEASEQSLRQMRSYIEAARQ